MPAHPLRNHARPWNKGLLIGQKKPLQPKHVWSIRFRPEIARLLRVLALSNLAIDNKLRACDLVKLRLDEDPRYPETGSLFTPAIVWNSSNDGMQPSIVLSKALAATARRVQRQSRRLP